MRRHCVILLLLILGSLAPRASAQTPFSTVNLFAGPAADLRIGELTEYWQPSRGAIVRIATPFYLGSVAGSFHLASYDSRADAQPDFRMLTTTVEWNLEPEIDLSVRPSAGIHVGATSMQFGESADPGVSENENEFVAGIQAGFTLPVTPRLAATVMVAHRRVYTRIPLRLTFLTAGVSWSAAMPGFIRDILE